MNAGLASGAAGALGSSSSSLRSVDETATTTGDITQSH